MLKQMITDSILLSNGLPNISKIKHDGKWIKKYLGDSIYQQIFSKTSFLPENCKFTERIYCILNDITNPICPYCNDTKLHFFSITVGYLQMCKKCVAKNRKVSDKQKVAKTKKNKTINDLKLFNYTITTNH